MAIHPSSSFPIRASDQADVIRIFLELMRERYPSRREPEVISGCRSSSDRPAIPGELLDLD
jgi:hypothetical protein